MVNDRKLVRDAIAFSVCDKLVETYRVNIHYLPEEYIAADIMYQGDTGERMALADGVIHMIEKCVRVPAHEISYVSFPDNTPEVTLNDGTSFLMMMSVGKQKSWRASRSAKVDTFYKLIGCETHTNEGIEQDQVEELERQLHNLQRSHSPDIVRSFAKSLVPASNFISIDIDQKGHAISSTCFFYTDCGKADKRVELPQTLLETRRMNTTTIRCILDCNWIIDTRLRRNACRMEWFLKDYPIGVIQDTIVGTLVRVRV